MKVMHGQSRSLDAVVVLGAGEHRIALCVRAGDSGVDALYSGLELYTLVTMCDI